MAGIRRIAGEVLICSTAAIGWVAAAAADYVDDNHSWALICNSSGYQLKSKYPVSRFIEAGIDSKVVEGVEALNLGKSCDALGNGKWCWANGGFTAEFENLSIGFPRQELSCPDAKDDLDDCRC